MNGMTLFAAVLMAMPHAVSGQGTLVDDSVASPGLVTNAVGDRSVRPLAVYLPPFYHTQSNRRYPVLYMLHGVTSEPGEWLDGKTYQGIDLRSSSTVSSRRERFPR